MEFLITTIVAVILLVGVVSSCPEGCRCSNVPAAFGDGVAVYCDKRGLGSIPTGFPSNTYALYLGNNNISKIEENAFNNLPKLTALYLGNNIISTIEKNAFNNLPKLVGIYMSNNTISFVSEKAFVNLPQQTGIYFDMHCGGCNNIPFWRWVKLSQRTGLYITCNDFHEKSLSSLQQQDFIGCPGEYLCTWF